MVSGSEDGEIIFWDVRSKEIVQRVTGHEGVVCWVDTSPGSSGAIVSGGLDGTVRIWVDVPEDDGVGEIQTKAEIGLDLDDHDAEMNDVNAEEDSKRVYGDDSLAIEAVDEVSGTAEDIEPDKMEED